MLALVLLSWVQPNKVTTFLGRVYCKEKTRNSKWCWMWALTVFAPDKIMCKLVVEKTNNKWYTGQFHGAAEHKNLLSKKKDA